jgi:uncharacterized protein (TIGR03086 family)
LYGFDHVARLIPADAWDNPSPNPGWTARSVLGHVTAIQRHMEALVRGTTSTMNPMVDPHRHAGDDPYRTWADARDAILEALDHEGVLQREVDNWNGRQKVDFMVGFNVGDTTIHAWDLARAGGVDDRLVPELVERVYAGFSRIADSMRGPMMFGDAVDVPPDADLQTRLLGLVGRRA